MDSKNIFSFKNLELWIKKQLFQIVLFIHKLPHHPTQLEAWLPSPWRTFTFSLIPSQSATPTACNWYSGSDGWFSLNALPGETKAKNVMKDERCCAVIQRRFPWQLWKSGSLFKVSRKSGGCSSDQALSENWECKKEKVVLQQMDCRAWFTVERGAGRGTREGEGGGED